MDSKIAEMDNGKLAHVHADAEVGDLVKIWSVLSGKHWEGRIIRFI